MQTEVLKAGTWARRRGARPGLCIVAAARSTTSEWRWPITSPLSGVDAGATCDRARTPVVPRTPSTVHCVHAQPKYR